MKIENVPVGSRFRVTDEESSDYGLIFVRTETGAEISADVRTLDNWEDVEVVE